MIVSDYAVIVALVAAAIILWLNRRTMIAMESHIEELESENDALVTANKIWRREWIKRETGIRIDCSIANEARRQIGLRILSSFEGNKLGTQPHHAAARPQ